MDPIDSQLAEDEFPCIGNAGERSNTSEQAPTVATRSYGGNGRQTGKIQYQNDGCLMWLDPTSEIWSKFPNLATISTKYFLTFCQVPLYFIRISESN